MKTMKNILLIILLITMTTGCNNKLKEESKSYKEREEEKQDYEKKVLNSTVNINTDTLDYGAGFIYKNSYIITNYHVVYDAKNIKIYTYNKEEYDASLIGYNVEFDIAVLKINKELESIVLGDSDKIKAGEKVTAIGNPNGELSFSKAEGKILNIDKSFLDLIDKQRKYIWYDGDAISGYSGGPVYDEYGNVLGILNARYYGDLSNY